MDPLKLLQEDLTSPEPQVVIQACCKLTAVATGMGAQRTRDELVPFLASYVKQDENDEANATIALQLGEFTGCLGSPTHIPLVLPVLEECMMAEETLVRENAVQGCNMLMRQMKKEQITSLMIPMIQRMTENDWFTGRASATGLFTSIYPHCNEQQQDDLREVFARMCADDAPLVRKSAFLNLGAFGACHSKALISSDIIPIVKTIQADDSGTMRCVAIDVVVALAQVVDAVVYVDELQPIVEQLHNDKSWRVRKALCEKIPALCIALGPDAATRHVIPVFAQLLQDPEAEVRSLGAKVIIDVCQKCTAGAALLQGLGPSLEGLSQDSAQEVRLEFSLIVGQLVSIMGGKNKDAAIQLLLPVIEDLCKDDDHQVRNNVVLSIDKISNVVPADQLSDKLLPTLLSLAQDPKWRVRMAVIDKVASISEIIGQQGFDDKLQKLIIVSLSDHVYAIREHACQQIGLLVKQFGGAWAGKSLFPTALRLFDKSSNYLHRMTCLSFIVQSAPHLSSDIINKHLLPIVVQAATDAVANVRIAACQTFQTLQKPLDAAIYSKTVTPLLAKLTKDPDCDVAHFAQVAVKNK
jgi:serine/threonine-protein phosphatase 2A regulatory subunit A